MVPSVTDSVSSASSSTVSATAPTPSRLRDGAKGAQCRVCSASVIVDHTDSIGCRRIRSKVSTQVPSTEARSASTGWVGNVGSVVISGFSFGEDGEKYWGASGVSDGSGVEVSLDGVQV